MSEPFNVRLVESRLVSPYNRHFVFERTDGKPCTFVPGQWFNLFVPRPDGEVRRAYSIASAPDGTPRFELVVTLVPGGPATEALFSMSPGVEMRAVGPMGMFSRDATDPSPSLFVGTGAGIAPLRSMIKAALAIGSRTKLSLVFGVRHEEDILYRQEIEGWEKELPNLRVRVTLSQPHEAWTGRRGYVQVHLREAWAELDAPEGHVYICGLQKMVNDVRDQCRKDLEIDRKRVHQERFD